MSQSRTHADPIARALRVSDMSCVSTPANAIPSLILPHFANQKSCEQAAPIQASQPPTPGTASANL